MGVQRCGQRLHRHAMLDIPFVIDDHRHDPGVQTRRQRMGSLRLVDVGRHQHGVPGAGNRGQSDVQALCRTPRHIAAEVGMPCFGGDLVRPLDDLSTFRAIIQPLGGRDVRIEDLAT